MGDVAAAVDRLQSGLLSPLAESLTLNEMVQAGTRKRDICRWLDIDRSELDRRLAIQNLPKSAWPDINSGRLTREKVYQLLRLGNIFTRYMENRRQSIEEDEFLAFWVSHYQKILAAKYRDLPLEDLKPAVDEIYYAAVGVMERKFASIQDMFLELDALRPGWAGAWARVRKVFRRVLSPLRRAPDAENTGAK